MHAVSQREPGYGGVTIIGETGDDRIDRMDGEVCADGIRMPDIEETRNHSLKPQLSNKVFGSLQVHITQMDLVVALLGEETGDQRTNLARAEDKDSMHEEPRFAPSILLCRILNTWFGRSGRSLGQ
jgi:hypothetical protein